MFDKKNPVTNWRQKLLMNFERLNGLPSRIDTSTTLPFVITPFCILPYFFTSLLWELVFYSTVRYALTKNGMVRVSSGTGLSGFGSLEYQITINT